MVSIVRRIIIALFGPLYFIRSMFYYKLHYTPLKSPKTRFKSAYAHLHNQLTELLIENVPLVSMDIGGTLTKVLLFIPNQQNVTIKPQYLRYFQQDQSFEIQSLKCRFLFFRFETVKFNKVIQFLLDHKLPYCETHVIRCTGGGGYKYREFMIHQLQQQGMHVRIEIHDEMNSLQQGLVFSTSLNLKNAVHSVIKVPNDVQTAHIFDNVDLNLIKVSDVQQQLGNYNLLNKFKLVKQPVYAKSIFPCLLVQIGSGVSIIKCESDTWSRVDGSALGGGSFFNMQYLITQESNFDFVMLMASLGRSEKMNLLMQDIQKVSSQSDGTQVVSCFGKFLQNCAEVNKCDKVRAMLYLFAQNLAQLAFLNCRIHEMKRVVFAGGFCCNDLVKDFLSQTLGALSGNKIQCLFLSHESVIGTIGSMIGNEVYYQEFQDRVGITINELIEQLQESMMESETTELTTEFIFGSNNCTDGQSDDE